MEKGGKESWDRAVWSGGFEEGQLRNDLGVRDSTQLSQLALSLSSRLGDISGLRAVRNQKDWGLGLPRGPALTCSFLPPARVPHGCLLPPLPVTAWLPHQGSGAAWHGAPQSVAPSTVARSGTGGQGEGEAGVSRMGPLPLPHWPTRPHPCPPGGPAPPPTSSPS